MTDTTRPLIPQVTWRRYRVRRCLSLHHCEVCDKPIVPNDLYHDGGYHRRAHVACVDTMTLDRTVGAEVMTTRPLIDRLDEESHDPMVNDQRARLFREAADALRERDAMNTGLLTQLCHRDDELKIARAQIDETILTVRHEP